MKKTIIRAGLETLYFSGMHHWLRPLVGWRRRNPDPAPCATGAPGGLPAQPAAGSHAGLSGGAATAACPCAHRRCLARRNASAFHRRRFQAPLRLPDVRRRLQGFFALGLSAAAQIQTAVRDVYRDQLSRPARRTVVGRARSGDRAKHPHRHGDQRQGPVFRMRDRARKARTL